MPFNIMQNGEGFLVHCPVFSMETVIIGKCCVFKQPKLVVGTSAKKDGLFIFFKSQRIRVLKIFR